MSMNSAWALQRLPEETISVIAPMPEAIFEERAARLKFLAPGNLICDYLDSMAALAKSQGEALNLLASANSVGSAQVPRIRGGASSYEEILPGLMEVIVSGMQSTLLPPASYEALRRLKSATPADLVSSAQAILDGNHASMDIPASPFLSAALQVYWTDLASRVQMAPMEKTTYVCPVCGSPPIAGLIYRDRKLRYLCCSLCSTQWYVPRLTCVQCGSTASLTYFLVEGDKNGTKAEACKQCRTYLKLFYLESNPNAEALSDDLATLALDLLMADQAYGGSGRNLFLL
jgi:FdhE protein